MKITVVTATWNSQATIADAISSVANQSYSDVEHLIVDGASSDNTLKIVADCAGQTVKVVSEPDKGIYDALNKGIALATGDVVGFLHSDDIFAHCDVLKEIAARFDKRNLDAVYGDLDYVSKDNVGHIVRHWKSSHFSRKKLLFGWMPPHPTFYMTKNCYEQFGAFDLKYKIAADYDAVLRYFGKYGIRTEYIPQVLVKMRLGGASNRSFRNILKKSSEDFNALINNGFPPLRAIVGKNLSKLPQFIV